MMIVKLVTFGSVQEVEIEEGDSVEDLLKKGNPKVYEQWKKLKMTARVHRKC